MKPIQMQLTVTLGESAAKALAELLVPGIKEAVGSRDSRLPASPNASLWGESAPAAQELLIDSKEAARLLNVSPRTLWRMYTTGEMPAPVRIGRAVRWSLDGLRRCVEAGCPADRAGQLGGA